MEKKSLILQELLIFAFLLLFLSCSNYKSSFYNVSGIYSAEKGDYNKAIILFGKAIEENSKAESYLVYNTGAVYRDMGEHYAAAGKFRIAEAGADKKLLYRIYFEYGVIAFKAGEYDKAADFFKKAVIIDNSDIKLLRNLELALLRMADDLEEQIEEYSDSYDAVSDKNNKTVSEKILDLMFSGEVPFWLYMPDYTEITDEKIKDW